MSSLVPIARSPDGAIVQCSDGVIAYQSPDGELRPLQSSYAQQFIECLQNGLIAQSEYNAGILAAIQEERSLVAQSLMAVQDMAQVAISQQRSEIEFLRNQIDKNSNNQVHVTVENYGWCHWNTEAICFLAVFCWIVITALISIGWMVQGQQVRPSVQPQSIERGWL